MSYTRIVLKAFGGPEQLDVEQVDALPEPAAGEVRVRVLTAGTGFTDTIIRQGQYTGVKDKPPFVPGYDWFGVVDKLGAGVSGFSVGQYIADMPVIGGYTQYLCAPASQLVAAPDGLDPEAAVAMILSYTTAYQMLTRIREIPAGSRVLVHAGGGAVGSALLELGQMLGLEQYATGSAAKHELIQRYGATAINYREQDFVDEIMKHTDGRGVDVVFDTIGGKNWSRSYRCLDRGGLLVAYGALQLTTGEESLPSLMAGFAKLMLGWKLIPDGKATTFYNIQTRREKKPDEFTDDLQKLFELLSEGKLKPPVSLVVDLQQAADLHRKIDNAEIAGKAVLRCNQQ